MVEFRLLGPVEVWVGQRRLDAGQPRQRTVLAALLADVGRVVSTQALVDRVWGEHPPQTARHSLHSHLARVRRVLAGADEPVRLVYRSGGYLIDAPADQVDLHRFRELLRRARQAAPTDDLPLTLLREAVALWRGEPLAGIPGVWAGRMREGWVIERLDAVVEWATAELANGNVPAVLGPLSALVVDHPLVEPLAALHLRALAAAGRPAEALTAYGDLRQRLVDELGTDPGPELQTVHRAILRGELAPPPRPVQVPAAAQASSPVQAPVPVRPAQLPADVPAFAGRAEPLGRLDALLGGPGARAPATVTISAVSGMAGVGKTALAVHWAHRVAEHFPDGQLYANLRGFDPGGAPVSPAEALRGFLDAFAVPAQWIPAALDAQTTLYRSTLAGKRVLVLLDNARDAEQVRPLLPGAPGCLALVTSRNQLTGLVATEGAQPVVLDILPVAEARDLLARRLGADRVGAEPEAVDRIVAACARLPLALSIAAARAQQTGFPLAEIAAELHAAGHRLDALDAGDAVSQVRSVFSWSYTAMAPQAARLFRLLGTHPGTHLSVAAAASLAGLAVEPARALLSELARAHLVSEQSTGRYALHDLLRSYATELTQRLDSGDDRRAATRRMLDHYLHTAYAADRLIHPERDTITIGRPCAGAVVVEPTRPDQAQRWFATERPALLRMVELAAAEGFDRHTWRLAWTLTDILQRHGRWDDQLDIQHAALDAGRRLADRAVQLRVHRDLARAYLRLGRHGDALAQIREGLELAHQFGDQAGHAGTHLTFSKVLEVMGDNRGALHHARRALALFRAAGNRHGQANALNSVGWLCGMLADHERALAYCQRALALHEQLDNRIGAALTRDSVGYIRHQSGRHQEAAHDFRRAIDLLRELGDRFNEAIVLDHLGDTVEAAGDPGAARECWRQALAILDELGHHDAKTVRAKLAPDYGWSSPTDGR